MATPTAPSSASSMTETNSSSPTRRVCSGGQPGLAANIDDEPSNPTRDTLADGLVGLLRPSLETLDQSVADTRLAQNELKDKIDALEQQLIALQAQSESPVDLEAYINKLTSSKKRILVVNSILQGAQVRERDTTSVLNLMTIFYL